MRAKIIALAVVSLVASAGLADAAPAKRQAWYEGWSMDDARLSQPRFQPVVEAPFSIPMSDGVELEARVIRPKVPADVRVPAILHISPYISPGLPEHQIAPELQKDAYVERGYALVGVTIRGFGGSGGCVDYQGPRDREDVDAVLDAIGTLPWSNGKLGVIGLSWDGTTANSAIVSGNEHLVTAVPVAGITDWYLWSYMSGVPVWYSGYNFNAYAMPAVNAVRAINGVPSPAAVVGRACEDVAHSVVAQEQTAAVGTRTEWWDEHDLTTLTDRARRDVAVLQVTGQRDDGVRVDHLHSWDRKLRERSRNYRLILGDWMHMWPDTPDQPAANNPDVRFNPYAMTSWEVLLLRWFDHWLKGKPTGIMQMPGALVQDQRGAWHGETALDPAAARRVRLHPGPEGLQPRVQTGQAQFVDNGDNVNPTGSCVYFAGGVRVGCVPVQQPNALFFTTSPVSRETRYTGVARGGVTVTSTTPTGTLGITLYDVDETGETWIPLTYGITSMNVRKDPYTFEPLPMDEPVQIDVELLARDIVIPRGHRLGLGIGGQVGRSNRGLSGNGYGPLTPGGPKVVDFGPGTYVDLSVLPAGTKVLPIR